MKETVLYLSNLAYFQPTIVLNFLLKLIPLLGFAYNNLTDPEWYLKNADWFKMYHFVTAEIILLSIFLPLMN